MNIFNIYDIYYLCGFNGKLKRITLKMKSKCELNLENVKKENQNSIIATKNKKYNCINGPRKNVKKDSFPFTK